MRVLLCPDKFAGTLSAPQVAAAVADGWREIAPDDDLLVRPLADGGPGFIDVLAAALPGRRIPVATVDPLGRPVPGEILLTDDGATAWLESAQACGLHLLDAGERDPRTTTSYGLGLLITAAVEAGARTVVVGLGGSATNDGGAGMLAALGAVALDDTGTALPYGGAALTAVATLDGAPRLRDVRLIAATDVDNPLLGLHGASNVFGPQKGADRADVLLLDAALQRWAEVLQQQVPGCPSGLGALPGGGAAGGIGAALLALGGRCESGIGLVSRAVGLNAALDGVDLVITGEGKFDHQSLRGKVVAGVAGAARDQGVPCVVLAGQVSTGRREAASVGVTEAYSLVEHFGGEERGGLTAALERPGEGLRALGARLARQWSR
ncbi:MULTISPECIES: glycerate kinase family protein [Micromonospora]|uniref:glycerate kinase family protein n=1 Tax=Micromonospora TaxID=1873 RepID=UPI000F86A812|nr:MULTISPECIES: glycerate kinase [Micromonospora]RUL94195.1 glycerate kinase [Verrucosispora sp. FIM060022]WSK41892.1 glycerate kinase [Micromonospora maris]